PSVCVLSRRPRHPSPALLPYTTLFRSHRVVGQPPRAGRLLSLGGLALLPALLTLTAAVHLRQPHLPGRLQGVEIVRQRLRQPRLDRKSTRLNSSHVSTSYAVFCLKKQP